jgi:hypothetical protein
LKAALDAAKKEKRTAVTILVNSFGRLWTEHGFRTSWDKAFRKTALKDLHFHDFHDLRGTAVTPRAVEVLGARDRPCVLIDGILRSKSVAKDSVTEAPLAKSANPTLVWQGSDSNEGEASRYECATSKPSAKPAPAEEQVSD